MMQSIKACFGLLEMYLELVFTTTEGILLAIAFAAVILLLIVAKRMKHLWLWIAQWLLEIGSIAYALACLGQALREDSVAGLYVGFSAIMISMILSVLSMCSFFSGRKKE